MSTLDATSVEQEETTQEMPRRLAVAFHNAELSSLKHAAIARAIALAVILAWLFVQLGKPASFFVPHFIVFAAIPTIHYALARGQSARSWHGYLLFSFDAALLTFALLFPNPLLLEQPWPLPTSFRFGNFLYYFVL
ncbi:MAG: hypothetical protein OER92_08315, partial [Alphaproteobacteria bacterium]|nr:hypothetical protein [Alphaproteobacteria bacterium]